MMDALIGHSGFVGSILSRQRDFDVTLNSGTIDDAAGASFGTVLCAAAPGSMFDANRLPERDRQGIDRLIGQLRRIEAERFVLISTIAVLNDFAAADEDTADFETEVPYGAHRRRLEEAVADRFPGALIIRLPALFGEGLKKNFLFDLDNPVPSMLTDEALARMTDGVPADLAALVGHIYRRDDALSVHVVDRDRLAASGRRRELEAAVDDLGLSAVLFTNPDSRFQFYDMTRLWRDIERGLDHRLGTLHLAPEPVAAAEIYRVLRGTAMPRGSARLHQEDMRTAHAGLWGGSGPYIASGEEVIAGIADHFRRTARP